MPASGLAASQGDDGRLERHNGTDAVLTALVPAGWTIEQAVTGDLNGDGRPDAVVSLRQYPTPDTREDQEGHPRALLILFADASGGYYQQTLATRLLPCATCLGMLGAYAEANSPVNIAIAAGKLRIGWLQGSREAVEVSLVFGYDAALRSFRLLQDDVSRVDRVLGREIHTVRDLVAGKITVNGKTRLMQPRVILLTAVDYSTY
jgi:hypothetical protein